MSPSPKRLSRRTDAILSRHAHIVGAVGLTLRRMGGEALLDAIHAHECALVADAALRSQRWRRDALRARRQRRDRSFNEGACTTQPPY
jgi:hypothetical protein